jgi:hypothetical protein
LVSLASSGSANSVAGTPRPVSLRFHRRELGRLMLERVQAVRVAEHDLHRHHDREKQQRHLHHHAAFVGRAPLRG